MTDHWFVRGAQSAFVYYACCDPCLDRAHKGRRMREAEARKKEKAALQLEQPGLIQQPVSFQTNPYWTQEILAGPMLGHENIRKAAAREAKLRAKAKAKAAQSKRHPPPGSADGPADRPAESPVSDPVGVDSTLSQLELALTNIPTEYSQPMDQAGTGGAFPKDGEEQTELTKREAIVEGFKSIIRPENWNWIHHDRPDEVLWGYEAIKNRLIGKGREDDPTSHHSRTPKRNRALTTDSSDSFDYGYAYARHPEVNDLHPPVVSQLPRTREECAWMIQPPPPAAVMEGRVHPDDVPLPPRPQPKPPSPTTQQLRRRDTSRQGRQAFKATDESSELLSPPAIKVIRDSSASSGVSPRRSPSAPAPLKRPRGHRNPKSEPNTRFIYTQSQSTTILSPSSTNITESPLHSPIWASTGQLNLSDSVDLPTTKSSGQPSPSFDHSAEWNVLMQLVLSPNDPDRSRGSRAMRASWPY